MAVTNAQILDFLLANPGLSDAQLVTAMQQNGVSPAQMSQVVGIPLSEVQQRYDAVSPPARTVATVSNAQIVDFLQANPGLSDADIVKVMAENKVSPAQLATAVGLPVGEVISRVASTVPQGSSVTLGDTRISPNYQVTGSGESEQIGALDTIIVEKTTGDINYKAPTGSTYQQYGADGTFQRTGVTQKEKSFFGGLKDALTDPVVLAALGGAAAGGLFSGAGALGGGAASGGLLGGAGTVAGTALTATELAALDLALGGAGGTAGATSLASALATGAEIGTLTNLTGGSGLLTGEAGGITAQSVADKLAADAAAQAAAEKLAADAATQAAADAAAQAAAEQAAADLAAAEAATKAAADATAAAKAAGDAAAIAAAEEAAIKAAADLAAAEAATKAAADLAAAELATKTAADLAAAELAAQTAAELAAAEVAASEAAIKAAADLAAAEAAATAAADIAAASEAATLAAEQASAQAAADLLAAETAAQASADAIAAANAASDAAAALAAEQAAAQAAADLTAAQLAADAATQAAAEAAAVAAADAAAAKTAADLAAAAAAADAAAIQAAADAAAELAASDLAAAQAAAAAADAAAAAAAGDATAKAAADLAAAQAAADLATAEAAAQAAADAAAAAAADAATKAAADAATKTAADLAAAQAAADAAAAAAATADAATKAAADLAAAQAASDLAAAKTAADAAAAAAAAAAAGTTTAGTGTGLLTGATTAATTGATTAATTGATTAATTTAGTGTGLLTGVGTNLATGAITGAITGGTGTSTLGGLISGGLGTAGNLLQMQQSKEAAEKAQARIDAETAAAKQAAQFKPIGMTTRFGSSQFQTDPVTGQLTSAGYTLSPEAKAAQDRFVKLADQGITQAEAAQAQFAPLQTGAQSLFSLGNQYIAQSPQSVAQNYLNQQMALLQPGRELELATLQNKLQQQGRGGLSVAQGGTLGATTPELQALYNARATQEAQLAANAQQLGQKDVLFGAGLLDRGSTAMGNYYSGQQAAYAPYTTALGEIKNLETLAQQPFTLSTGLAEKTAAAGSRVGDLGLKGAQLSAGLATSADATRNLAAQSLIAAGSPNAQFGQALGGLFSGGLQSAFSQTAPGASGFGTGLAYGNVDLGLYL